jgi:LmbE family N-acetylglucosaminyl deacetylase
VLFMIQDRWQMPSLVVDITPYWQGKLALLRAYKSQFFRPEQDAEPDTYLTRADFLPHLEARAREMGHFIGVSYGEGFVMRGPVPLPDYRLLIT